MLRWRAKPCDRTMGDVAGTLIAVLVVGGPALFTNNGFFYDYTNHLWLVWVQEQAISQHLSPTYFVSAPNVGIFYPFFMFYGGTLYAATGALGAILGGSATIAYVAVSTAAIAAAYGSLVWLARQLGVRSWAAHAPAVTYVASAYYVTNIYGRGAWPEFIATSMLPLVASSGLSLLRAPRVRIGPCILFVVGVILLAGSHNITLLLGTIALVALGVGLVLALGRAILPTPGRAALIGALAVLSVGVDAWFLLPDLVHASSTAISTAIIPWSPYSDLYTPWAMFDPLRTVARLSGCPGLFVQTPDWFLAWSLVTGAVFWAGAGRGLRRIATLLLTLLVLTLLAVMVEPIWNALPKLIREVQFAYRLDTYVALFISGLVLTVVVAAQRSPRSERTRRFATVGLVAVTAVSTGLCVWQLWIPQTRAGASYPDREAALVSPHIGPRTWYDTGVYADLSAPLVTPDRAFLFDANSITGDRVRLTVTLPPRLPPTAINLLAGPYAVSISGGAIREGRSSTGDAVIRRTSDSSGPTQITIATAGGAVTTGQRISEVAIGMLLIAFVTGVVRALRQRRPHVVPS